MSIIDKEVTGKKPLFLVPLNKTGGKYTQTRLTPRDLFAIDQTYDCYAFVTRMILLEKPVMSYKKMNLIIPLEMAKEYKSELKDITTAKYIQTKKDLVSNWKKIWKNQVIVYHNAKLPGAREFVESWGKKTNIQLEALTLPLKKTFSLPTSIEENPAYLTYAIV